MPDLATIHEAEQRAITEAWEACRARLTPCEVAREIMDETETDSDSNTRRAARVLLAIAPAYDDDTTEQGIKDALSDLMHLCDLAGWDFAAIEGAARRNYAREVLDLGIASNRDLRATIAGN